MSSFEKFAIFLLVLAIALAILVGVGALFGWIFMLLWNFAIVDIFHAPILDFWHAWAFSVLLGFVGSTFRATFSSKNKD